MSPESRQKIDDLIQTLKQERDQIKVQLHLAKEDLKDQWDELESKYVELNKKYEPTKAATSETAGHIWESLKLVGEELRDGYHRIRKSL